LVLKLSKITGGLEDVYSTSISDAFGFSDFNGNVRLSQNDGIKAAYILVNFLKGADDVV